jgi:polysaccharide biosynthesis protein PslH
MKILSLTPQRPFPPQQGTQIRNFHLLKALAGAHRVDLLSFSRPGEAIEVSSPLRQLCGQMALLPAPRRSRARRLSTLLTSRLPDVATRLSSDVFGTAICQFLKSGRYDAVQVEGIEMASYIPLIRATSPRTAIVFDDHNAEYLLQRRAAVVDARRPAGWPGALYSLVQWFRLKRYEAWACSMADAVLAVSEEDATALRKLAPGIEPVVVPNGVDTSYYQWNRTNGAKGAELLFTGTMDFRPNVDAMRWFTSDILPRLSSHRQDVRLHVVGRAPSSAVLRLAAKRREVVVTGPVEDVRPYFRQSSVFVIPMRIGGGVRLKLLEALAMGVPVVSTTMGAAGTGLVNGKEILLADTPGQFAREVLRLLENPALRYKIAGEGHRAAEERFDWSKVTPPLLELYAKLEGRRQGGHG